MDSSSEKDNVTAALSALRQTLDEEKERLNAEVAQAMKNGEYDMQQSDPEKEASLSQRITSGTQDDFIQI